MTTRNPLPVSFIISDIRDLLSSIRELTGDAQILSDADTDRLKFLGDTVNLILAHVQHQDQHQNDTATASDVYQMLIANLATHVSDIKHLVNGIGLRQININENFDIFEFCLRRMYGELVAMGKPVDGSPNGGPAAIIKNPDALLFWETNFCNLDYVSFSLLYSALAEELELDAVDTLDADYFHKFCRYVLNFPKRDYVTIYQWHQFTHLFGSFDATIVDRVCTLVSTGGFLGLTNRIRAEEILRSSTNNKILLIRFSRTEPEFIAFSYKHGGAIAHFINKSADGQSIPIGDFLKLKFTGFSVVKQRIDLDQIDLANGSMMMYANNNESYIVV